MTAECTTMIWKRLLKLFFCCSAVAQLAVAEQVPLRGDRLPLQSTLQAREAYRQRTFHAMSPLHLSFHSRGGIRAQVTLQQVRARTWTAAIQTSAGMVQSDGTDVVLFRGTARIKTRSHPAAGAVFRDKDGIERLHLYVLKPQERTGSVFLEVLIPTASPLAPARVRRIPAAALADVGCGADGILPSPRTSAATSSAPLIAASTSNRVIELAARYDPLFLSHYGAAANAQIASLVNTADTIYQRDLGLQFDLEDTRAHPVTASSDATTALSDWRDYNKYTYSSSPSDVYVLFTGQDFATPDTNIIGIAYVGTLCQSQAASAAVIQDYDSAINWIIFAHEVGHTLSGVHTSSGIMGAVLNPSEAYFATDSQALISSYVASYGSCLTPAGSTPTPTPTPSATSTPGGSTTPTPTPIPTATRRAGGGGGSGSDPNPGMQLPALTLATSLSLTGAATATFSRSFDVPAGCEEVFQISRSKLMYNSTLVYPEGLASSGSISFTMPGRLVAPKSYSPSQKRNLQVYVRYGIICSQAASQSLSAIQSFNAKKITARAIPRVSAQRLQTLVADAISSAL